VLLPEPEGPTIATISPRGTAKLIACKTSSGRPSDLMNRFQISVKAIAAAAAEAVDAGGSAMTPR
jgi:hypothetical protein